MLSRCRRYLWSWMFIQVSFLAFYHKGLCQTKLDPLNRRWTSLQKILGQCAVDVLYVFILMLLFTGLPGAWLPYCTYMGLQRWAVMLNVHCSTSVLKLTPALWLSKPASDDHTGQSNRSMVVCDWYGVNTGNVQSNMVDLSFCPPSGGLLSRISPSAHTGDQNLNCSIEDNIWFDLCAITFPSLVFF